MEEIAYTVGIDVMEVKINNFSPITSGQLTDFWTTMQTFGEIADRRAACEVFNKVSNIF